MLNRPASEFDANLRIAMLRSWISQMEPGKQVDKIKATIRLHEEGVSQKYLSSLDPIIIQGGVMVHMESINYAEPYWIEVSLRRFGRVPF